MRFYISNNSTSLTSELKKFAYTATVEAEYGSTTVRGNTLTLAHHGENAGNPPPCTAKVPQFYIVATDSEGKLGMCVDNTLTWEEATMAQWQHDEYGEGRDIVRTEDFINVVGISHFDLDTLGGIMAILGRRKENNQDKNFWRTAGLVDIKGVHHLDNCLREGVINFTGEVMESEELMATFAWLEGSTKDSLNAFWAWSQENKLYAPRDGSVLDCTDFIMKAIDVIERILDNDKELLDAGYAWATSMSKVEKESFSQVVGDKVIVRMSDNFVNHLYNHDGKTYAAVVGFNTKTGSITVSLADPIKGISCKRLVQGLWGDQAGGHDGIAGSPRDESLGFKHAVNAAEVLYAQMVRLDLSTNS